MIYVRDVAHVRDGFGVQQNIVRSDGVRASLLTIIKNGAASTLDIVARIKQAVPQVAKTLPPGLEIRTLLDQSLFVRAAVQSVIKEAVIAACLTALMILIFHDVCHRDFHPAGHPVLGDHAERAGGDDEHHDAGGAGAGGGDSGG